LAWLNISQFQYCTSVLTLGETLKPQWVTLTKGK